MTLSIDTRKPSSLELLQESVKEMERGIAALSIGAEVERWKNGLRVLTIVEEVEQCKKLSSARNIAREIFDLHAQARRTLNQSLQAFRERVRIMCEAAERIKSVVAERLRHRGHCAVSSVRKTPAAKKNRGASAKSGSSSGGGNGDGGGDSDGPHHKRRSSKQNSQRPPRVPPGAIATTSSPPPRSPRPPQGSVLAAFFAVILLVSVAYLLDKGERDLALYILGPLIAAMIAYIKPPGEKR